MSRQAWTSVRPPVLSAPPLYDCYPRPPADAPAVLLADQHHDTHPILAADLARVWLPHAGGLGLAAPGRRALAEGAWRMNHGSAFLADGQRLGRPLLISNGPAAHGAGGDDPSTYDQDYRSLAMEAR